MLGGYFIVVGMRYFQFVEVGAQGSNDLFQAELTLIIAILQMNKKVSTKLVPAKCSLKRGIINY